MFLFRATTSIFLHNNGVERSEGQYYCLLGNPVKTLFSRILWATLGANIFLTLRRVALLSTMGPFSLQNPWEQARRHSGCEGSLQKLPYPHWWLLFSFLGSYELLAISYLIFIRPVSAGYSAYFKHAIETLTLPQISHSKLAIQSGD